MADATQSSKQLESARLEVEFQAGESAAQVVRQLRRDWSRKLARRALWFIGLPTALAAAYYGGWASDQFDSTAVVVLQGLEQASWARPDSLLNSQSASAGSSREMLAIREFVVSRSMFEAIDQRIGYVKHFQDSKWDMFARLSSHASRERAFRYYTGKVTANFDSASGTLTINARAFEPSIAKSIAESILSVSESMLATMVEHAHAEMLRGADRQASEAKERLLRARRQSALVKQANVSSGQGTGPIAGVGTKVAIESSPLARETGQLGEAVDKANLELSYAERAYESALAALVEARSYELHHPRVLVALSKPSLPDESTYPRRLASIATVLIFSSLIMGIGSLTVTAVREHVRV